jgi:hypothetical protein
MNRTLSLAPLCLVMALTVTGCNSSEPGGGSNVTLRDMEVVDGTANDAMVDLDSSALDGTAMANVSDLENATGNASAPRPAVKSKSAPATDEADTDAQPHAGSAPVKPDKPRKPDEDTTD